MTHPFLRGAICCFAGLALAGGCRQQPARRSLPPVEVSPAAYVAQLQLDEPTVSCAEEQSLPAGASPDAIDPENAEFHELPLVEAIALSLQNSQVMRDLGGTVLRNPELLPTTFDPALAFTHPLVGEEAALSAFDANLSGQLFYEDNDREFNNRFIGNQGQLRQHLGTHRVELSKRAATGSLFTLRKNLEYDYNNSIANQFGIPSGAWTSYLDAELRQPFLQGAGIGFNRLAGPDAPTGVVNGVLVSRIRTDISLAEFEIGVRNLLSNVENAYWDLYYAYRDFDAKLQARDLALETVRRARVRVESGQYRQDELQQAEEQYWRFQAEAQNALYGRLIEGTSTDSGSTGGTFRAPTGVRVAERRLRLIVGLPANDGRLLRPADEPTSVPVRFDWDVVSNESLALRTELRKQRWVVKQRELELLANRNFLLPQLDGLARYRLRGFGDDLGGANSATDTLFDGDFQEWQVGLEFSMPLGFRRAHAAVRNSELALARERALLHEQQRQILTDLTDAYADIRRSFDVLQSQFYRRKSALEQVNYIFESVFMDRAPMDLLLEAQRRLLEAEIQYFQTRVEYALSIKNLHFEKGTLLEYENVGLAEAPSTANAYVDAQRLYLSRGQLINYVCRDRVVSGGTSPVAALDGQPAAAETLAAPSPTDPRPPLRVD